MLYTGDCSHVDFILIVSLKPGEHVVVRAVGWRGRRQQEQKEETYLELLQQYRQECNFGLASLVVVVSNGQINVKGIS